MKGGRECLNCGQLRIGRGRAVDECPRCRYLGWAPTGALTETERCAFREHAAESRSLQDISLVSASA